MPWSDFDAKTEVPEPDKEQEALDRRVATVLDSEGNDLFLRYLQKIAHSRSYRPGREATDTAWSEGYRALAVELLGRAGKLP